MSKNYGLRIREEVKEKRQDDQEKYFISDMQCSM